jgi:phage shock protein PspC (stress-responsive transcriptional regulator)
MVRRPANLQDRDMTQTPGPSAPGDQQTTAGQQPPPGLDRANLRSYETLTRSTSDRKVAGVAGGLGRHLNIDPTILRVLLVVLCFFGGAGFLLYAVAWALVPEDGQTVGPISTRPSTRNALLIGAGILAAVLVVGDSWGGLGTPWPLVVFGGGALLFFALRGRGVNPTQDPTSTYPPGSVPGYPNAFIPGTGPATGPATGVTYAPPLGPGEEPPTPPWLPAPQPPVAYVPPPRRRGPRLFGPTLAVVAVALGSLGLYDASGGHVVGSAYPALALAVVGLMLVVGAFVGRAGGLIFLGFVATMALVVSSVVGSATEIRGGDRQPLRVTPTSATDVQPHYYVPSGQVRVDLSKVDHAEDLAGRSIEIGARVGEVVVVLPRDVSTHIEADISGPGQIDLPDRSTDGINTSLSETYRNGAGTSGTLSLHTHLFAGHIDVRTK